MNAPQQSPIITKEAICSLLESIDTCLSHSGEFEITLEKLCKRLGISPVDAYRVLYMSASELSGYVPEHFGLDNMNVLALFLSRFSDTDVEKTFHAAGSTLSSDDFSELAALFYDSASDVIDSHTPRKEEYNQMCSRFKRRRAFEVYKDYFFDVDSILEQTVSQFMAGRKCEFPNLSRSSVKRGLSLLFQQHIISISAIFERLYERLNGESSRSTPATQRNTPALQALGLTRPPANREELRLHYKTLMKTYHPDINPDGLEMSKKINAAYAELLASWSPEH